MSANSDYLMLNRNEIGILEGLKAMKDAGGDQRHCGCDQQRKPHLGGLPE